MFSVAMRWSDRLVGLVSTLVLARVLLPSDFGLVAMASIAVGLIDTFLDLGVAQSLIQNQDASKDDFDTAWTLRFIQSALAAIIVVIAAPLATSYYKDPRVTDIMRFMALSVVIGGTENIGIVNFQRNLEFGQEFRFFFLKRICGFVTTIAAVLTLRTYWALVIGTLGARVFGVAASFILHPHRPSFTLKSIRKIWSFSQWVLVRNIGFYLDTRLDKFLVGGREVAAVMGAYTLADEISALPSTEILAPMNRVLFPVFSRLQKNLKALTDTYLLAMGVQALVGIPAAVGIALVAPEAVMVTLGQKWMAAVPFVQIIAFVNVVESINTSGGYLSLSLGYVRTLSLFTWTQLLVFSALTIMIFPQSGALMIAKLRATVVLTNFTATTIFVYTRLPDLRWMSLARKIVRPLSGVLAMWLSVRAIESVVNLPVAETLILKITSGALVYGLTVLLLWQISGKPPGAEQYLLEKVGSLKGSGRLTLERVRDNSAAKLLNKFLLFIRLRG